MSSGSKGANGRSKGHGTNRQDESVQKHIDRVKQSKGSREGDLRRDTPIEQPVRTTRTVEPRRNLHEPSAEGSLGYPFISTVQVHGAGSSLSPLYRPEHYSSNFHTPAEAYGSSDYDQRGRKDYGMSHSDEYRQPHQSPGYTEPRVTSSREIPEQRYSLRNERPNADPYSMSTQQEHEPMETDDPHHQSGFGGEDHYRNHSREPDYGASNRDQSRHYRQDQHHAMYQDNSTREKTREEDEEYARQHHYGKRGGSESRKLEHEGNRRRKDSEGRKTTRTDPWEQNRRPGDQALEERDERSERRLQRGTSEPYGTNQRDEHWDQQDASADATGRRVDRQVSREFHEYKDKYSFIRGCCRKEHGTDPTIYVAKMRETFNDAANKIRKVEFGRKNKSNPEKVVMLVGATGSGKSTMINAVFNYMFGIEWEDEYRLKLIEEAAPGQMVNQAESQTNTITAYTIHHQPWFRVPYTITLVDTPGFGDTGGLKRDKEIMEQIRKFFMTKGPNGIDHLDAVGFVTQSSIPRLTPIQRYVFDSILSIFGKDIAQNIFMLLTFADGQKPQVLSGLKEAKMEYQNFYKFNNSALYVGGKSKSLEEEERSRRQDHDEDEDSDEEDEDDDDENYFDKMFWQMGAGNFNKFMRDLESVKPQSLVLTAEVLQERNELEISINGIHENIKMGLKKLEQLKMEQQVLKHHQADIDKNRNFTYEVEEPMLKVIPTRPGEYATNCTYCKMTCHEKCTLPVVKSLRMCAAMNWKGDCRICPENCSYAMHENQPFRYIIEMVRVTRTSTELKRRYEEAEGKKLSAKQLIEKCSEEFEKVQVATLDLTEQARKCLKRLNEIALKPNPLSTTDYIDLMIQEEEFVAGPGWKDTVNQLEEVKKRAEITRQFTEEGYDPFAGYNPKEKRPNTAGVVKQMYKDVKRSNDQV